MILAEHFRKNLREKEKKIRYISDKKVVDTENAFCYTHSCVRRKTECIKHLERYRSGHNEAVLKTVCPQGRVGSNPTLSAGDNSPTPTDWLATQNVTDESFTGDHIAVKNSAHLEKYPSWPKGHPWKGCRSLIAARGFKSLLLRSIIFILQ